MDPSYGTPFWKTFLSSKSVDKPPAMYMKRSMSDTSPLICNRRKLERKISSSTLMELSVSSSSQMISQQQEHRHFSSLPCLEGPLTANSESLIKCQHSTCNKSCEYFETISLPEIEDSLSLLSFNNGTEDSNMQNMDVTQNECYAEMLRHAKSGMDLKESSINPQPFLVQDIVNLFVTFSRLDQKDQNYDEKLRKLQVRTEFVHKIYVCGNLCV